MNNKTDELRKFNGLWTVEFISTIGRSGKGVVILHNKRLLGGDSGYYYTGNYDINHNRFSGNLFVIRHDPTGISVFGDVDSFKLSLSGEVDNLHFSAVASIPEMPQFKIKVVGNKKEDF
ncbi:MAG: hypothetical protein FJ134_17565 [Deltaproteobacteria bacterium]|nr:hypothetical protein [Deltaproteobacteria bacterium]